MSHTVIAQGNESQFGLTVVWSFLGDHTPYMEMCSRLNPIGVQAILSGVTRPIPVQLSGCTLIGDCDPPPVVVGLHLLQFYRLPVKAQVKAKNRESQCGQVSKNSTKAFTGIMVKARKF